MRKIFLSEQVREIDAYTIEHEPIPSLDLMERASLQFVNWFVRKFDSSRNINIFCGTGNNGGDGFAVARLLMNRNYKVKAYLVRFSDKLSEDCGKNIENLKNIHPDNFHEISVASEFPAISSNELIIDAIFGSGLSRPASGLARETIIKMNQSGASIVSIDIPSGLYGEDNTGNDPEAIVKAHHTLSFEFPFLSFFFAENEVFTGKWRVVSIGLHPDAIAKTATDYYLLSEKYIAEIVKKRQLFSHKGSFGHALVIAGKYGMMGASVLAVKSCLRGGTGLVTAHIPKTGYNIIQTAVPEALISLDLSEKVFSDTDSIDKYSAIAVGPGLGCDSIQAKALHKLLKEAEIPMVIDADALNILAENQEWLGLLKEKNIITPHPGEFDRLAGASDNAYERHLKQKAFAQKYNIVVVLKGAYTIICLPNGESFVNSTGNNGMATGGSGDVLTGLIASFLAQGYSPEHAAQLGVYIHGLAADLCLEEQSEESLLPGDIINVLGKAFNYLRNSKKKKR